MSGMTPEPIRCFRIALHDRGTSVRELAEQVGTARHHLSQILWGHFAGGTYWARIRACVTRREWEDHLMQLPHVAAWQARALGAPLPFRVRWVCGECGTGLGFRAADAETAPGMTQAGLCPACAITNYELRSKNKSQPLAEVGV